MKFGRKSFSQRPRGLPGSQLTILQSSPTTFNHSLTVVSRSVKPNQSCPVCFRRNSPSCKAAQQASPHGDLYATRGPSARAFRSMEAWEAQDSPLGFLSLSVHTFHHSRTFLNEGAAVVPCRKGVSAMVFLGVRRLLVWEKSCERQSVLQWTSADGNKKQEGRPSSTARSCPAIASLSRQWRAVATHTLLPGSVWAFVNPIDGPILPSLRKILGAGFGSFCKRFRFSSGRPREPWTVFSLVLHFNLLLLLFFRSLAFYSCRCWFCCPRRPRQGWPHRVQRRRCLRVLRRDGPEGGAPSWYLLLWF
jgi:hypothetical protein